MTTKHKIKNFPKSKFPYLGEPGENLVLVLQDSAEERSSGGIIIPDDAQQKPERGIVMAAGDRKDDKPSKYGPGDVVYFGKHVGAEIKLKGVDYLLMRYNEILLKL